jgi:Raf kinase inhibitor-like YbhB/YbcL family protein
MLSISFLEREMSLKITSTAFEDGHVIPKRYTGDGEDVSPPLAWENPPKDTKSFVLICDDPDAPRGTWVHWVLFDLPPGVRELDAAVPVKGTIISGAKQGTNSFNNLGYGGPAPPRGKSHRYCFKLFALDRTLGLAIGATKEEVLEACAGHVLAEAQLMGTYQR